MGNSQIKTNMVAKDTNINCSRAELNQTQYSKLNEFIKKKENVASLPSNNGGLVCEARMAPVPLSSLAVFPQFPVYISPPS